MSDLPLKIIDRSSLHHYRTEIPNIVFTLGLSPYELALYMVLKKTAGDCGNCTKSIKTLAKEVGCKETKLKEAKKSLCIPRKELENQALIIAFARQSENGDPNTDKIIITDLWPLNFRLFEIKKSYGGGSPHDPGVGRHTTQGGSPHDHKEEPIKEEETTTTEEEIVVASQSKKSSNTEIYDLLHSQGLDDSSIQQLMKLRPQIDEVTASLELAKSSKYDNLGAWLHQCIKFKWWASKSKSKASQEEEEKSKKQLIIESRRQKAKDLLKKYPDSFEIRENYIFVKSAKGNDFIGFVDEKMDQFFEFLHHAKGRI